MTREDWIWVAIRIFGIYLIVLAVKTVPGIIGSGYSTVSLRGLTLARPGEGGENALANLAQKLTVGHFTALLTGCVQLIVYFIAGWYLVSNGRWVFRLVSKQNPLSAHNDAPPNADFSADPTK